MKYKLKCSVCQQICGSLEKAQVSKQDRELYREQASCNQEHTGSVEIVEE